jgi:hypothetical protein
MNSSTQNSSKLSSKIGMILKLLKRETEVLIRVNNELALEKMNFALKNPMNKNLKSKQLVQFMQLLDNPLTMDSMQISEI